jgi:hypothetical protein
MVWVKVEGFVGERADGLFKKKTEGFGPNRPGPSDFRLADAHRVRPLGRATSPSFTTLLVARRAI